MLCKQSCGKFGTELFACSCVCNERISRSAHSSRVATKYHEDLVLCKPADIAHANHVINSSTHSTKIAIKETVKTMGCVLVIEF